MIKQLIKRTQFFPPLRNFWFQKRQARELRRWENNRHSAAPPHVIKQKALLHYAKQYNLKILIESGTYYGDMVEAMKDVFEKIYSIELSRELFDYAKKRFRHQKHIQLIHGDSGKELPKIMNAIDKAALFWLDGHYSGGVTAGGEKESPIRDELNSILDAPDLGHVIVIDDANLFGTDSTYPTIAELKEFIRSKRENIQITVAENAIRIAPII